MAADVTPSITSMAESTISLQRSLADLTDDQAAGASLLPGWTRGHVLTHVARNADALINLVTWARTGVETPMYPSREERDAVIQQQSSRSVQQLRDDIEASSQRLMAAMADLPPRWPAAIRWGAQSRSGPASAIPFLRRTEVEVHHVDLDLDYTMAHWPEDFIEALLTDISDEYSRRDDIEGFELVANEDQGRWTIAGGGPQITGPPPALLGWLTGRSNGIALHTDAEQLPDPGVWR